MGKRRRAFVGLVLGCSVGSCGMTVEVGCTYGEDAAACDQYSVDEDEVDEAEASCAADGLTIIAPCPLDDLVGCCVTERRGLPLHQCYYVTTPELVETYCTEHGMEFVPTP